MENEMITLVGMGLGTCFAVTILIVGHAIARASQCIAEQIAEREK